jgi:hypothetical protein
MTYRMARHAANVKPYAILLAAMTAITACQSGAPIAGDSRNVGAVTVSLRAEPARVKVGQTVRLTLSLQNNSGREQTLRYPSGQRYDFSAAKGRHKVWQWSDTRDFVQAETSETLPGQTGSRYSESWTPDEPGTYTVTALSKAQGFEDPLSGRVIVQ